MKLSKKEIKFLIDVLKWYVDIPTYLHGDDEIFCNDLISQLEYELEELENY